jgi:hypothetical protein
MDWNHLVQDRDQWRALGNTAMKLQELENVVKISE